MLSVEETGFTKLFFIPLQHIIAASLNLIMKVSLCESLSFLIVLHRPKYDFFPPAIWNFSNVYLNPLLLWFLNYPPPPFFSKRNLHQCMKLLNTFQLFSLFSKISCHVDILSSLRFIYLFSVASNNIHLKVGRIAEKAQFAVLCKYNSRCNPKPTLSLEFRNDKNIVPDIRCSTRHQHNCWSMKCFGSISKSVFEAIDNIICSLRSPTEVKERAVNISKHVLLDSNAAGNFCILSNDLSYFYFGKCALLLYIPSLVNGYHAHSKTEYVSNICISVK